MWSFSPQENDDRSQALYFPQHKFTETSADIQKTELKRQAQPEPKSGEH